MDEVKTTPEWGSRDEPSSSSELSVHSLVRSGGESRDRVVFPHLVFSRERGTIPRSKW